MMPEYLRSPPPVNDRAEDSAAGGAGGAHGYTPSPSLFPDNAVYREPDRYDSRESSPQTEEDLPLFGGAASSSDNMNLTKDRRPRKRAPKKYRVDFPDEESYQIYKRLMDKNRQKKHRDKKKQKKEEMNAGSLFPPSN